MTAIPAEVVAAHRLVDQYHVIVRNAHYRGSFATLARLLPKWHQTAIELNADLLHQRRF